MIIPIAVTDGSYSFTLCAIWANNPNDKDGQYIEQVWKAIHHYDNQLINKRIVMAGDFNSNAIWDRKHRASNHSNVVRFLEDKGIYSSYHLHHKKTQGEEKHPTLYMYSHRDKPYHVNNCFVSADMADNIQSVEIGNFDFWIKYSDHVPVIVRFDSSMTKRTNA